MTDEKKQKKAAQAIQALLELDGIKVTVKDISGKLEGESLTDLVKLKDKFANDMKKVKEVKEGSIDAVERRKVLGDYIVSHWDSLKDNAVVKNALLNAYCMGRIKAEQREVMAQELLDRVGAKVEKKVVVVKAKTLPKVVLSETPDVVVKVVSEDVVSETPVADVVQMASDHKQYTF
jgi:hypothetical protein